MKRLLTLALAVTALPSFGFVSFTGNYSQDFNTLASSGTPSWTDNSTITGWYAAPSFTSYEPDNGTSTVGGLKSYGTGTAVDRALGSFQAPGTPISYGVQLRNASSGTINTLSVAYFGEQWSVGGSGPFTDLITFEHSTSATSLTSGTWTNTASLDFVSPITGTAGPLDGNLPANRNNQLGTLTALNWTVGTDLWLRWTHTGLARDAMGIDDLVLQANPVPEPFTMALAAAGLGLAARRRLSTRRAS